jgi:hypothetical protein
VSRLSPSTSTREGGGGRLWIATILAVLLALVGGIGAGIWWAERNNDDASSTPTNCPSTVPQVITYPAPNTVTINVYNSTDRQGLARATADQMAARGYILGQVANDPKDATIPAPAEVRHGPTGLVQAQLVAFNVAGATLVDDQRADATVDLVVGDGFTVLAPPEQVTAATTAPTPSPLPAGCPTPTATAPPASPGAADPAATPAPSPS